jgi:hypothetical protein
VAQHYIADIIGALNVDEIKASAIVRGDKRIILAIPSSSRGLAMLVSLRKRQRATKDQATRDQAAGDGSWPNPS